MDVNDPAIKKASELVDHVAVALATQTLKAFHGSTPMAIGALMSAAAMVAGQTEITTRTPEEWRDFLVSNFRNFLDTQLRIDEEPAKITVPGTDTRQ